MSGPRKGSVRYGHARVPLHVRVDEAHMLGIDTLARSLGMQRSETIRLLLGYALTDPQILNRIEKQRR